MTIVPEPELVRRHLEAVLGSGGFVNSPRLSRFLRHVVEESLAGRAGNLKEYQLGLDVFERPGSFDPKIDPVVRVEARQLRFKLSQYYEGPGRDDQVLISVPKGAYAAKFEQRPSPPAAQPPPPPPPPKTTPKTPRWWIAAAALMAVFGAAWAWSARDKRAELLPSLVVLPFVNLSGDPAEEYLTSGLTDGLTGALARVKTLRVIAGASAAEFRGKKSDAREVGRELHVASVLEGDVVRRGNQARVTARLLRAEDASVQWTRTWEGGVGELYAAQAELAGGVAAALRASANSTRHVVRDAQAQDYFLRARYEADQLTRTSLEDAVSHYQKAIDRDPAYAAAWYGLAVAKHRLPAYAGDGRALDREAVEQAYRKAISLDTEFPEPHTGLALIAMQQDWDWARAERELDAANAIAPSAIAESHLAFLKLIQGKKTEMDQHIRRARDLDPLGSAVLMNTVEIQMYAGEFEAARQVAERFASQHPDVPAAAMAVAATYLFEGRAEEALKRYHALPPSPEAELGELLAHARAGRREEALRRVASLAAKDGVGRYGIAEAYGYLGDEARALEWLGRSAERREAVVVWAGVDVAFTSVRASPGFQSFERKLGLRP